MDLEFLKNGAAKFAYELRKNFPSDESPINHYVCDIGVVVLSTKKLYMMYCDTFIDYQVDELDNIVIRNINKDTHTCSIKVKKRNFDLEFASLKEMERLLYYVDKYK